MDETEAVSSPWRLLFWGRQQQLAALVAFHLGSTCPAAVLSSLFASPYHDESATAYRAIYAAVYGFQIGQLVLLATWGALAGEIWPCRMPRFLALMVWLLLLEFLGERLVLGRISNTLVEEQLAYKLILLFAPIIVIFSVSIFDSRRFFPSRSQRHSRNWQFSIFSMMRITAELAVLLAIGRFVFPRRFEFAEFSTALETLRADELIPAMMSASILPVAFFGLERSRTWWSYVSLVVFLAFLSLTLASSQIFLSLSGNGVASNSVFFWWPELGLMFAEYFFAHISAAATILFTFYLLRCIGYDFRRREELLRPGGRNSSNARNSAASASA